jgi:hypothetical protein
MRTMDKGQLLWKEASNFHLQQGLGHLLKDLNISALLLLQKEEGYEHETTDIESASNAAAKHWPSCDTSLPCLAS